MCGIAGFIDTSRQKNRQELEAIAMRMADSLRHRGPDDGGTWADAEAGIALGHRRLSIVDLSPAGHQPMVSHCGRYVISFNGEIYNFRAIRAELENRSQEPEARIISRKDAEAQSSLTPHLSPLTSHLSPRQWRGHSDTEVILEAYRAWGDDCLNRLNGMFAFALYDRERKRLLLARDRAGEKPLFYYAHPKGLMFASELKALMTLPDFPRQLDWNAFQSYLAFGYTMGEQCLLRGVKKLQAGHALSYSSGECRVWAYWQLPEYRHAAVSDDELVEELEGLLEDSVRKQMVADVPVGILLSGGVDSSLVTAMAARVSSKPVKTFTITFPGAGVHNEAAHARLIADHFGTEHTELEGSEATPDLLPILARQFDEPMCDSSMIPTFLVSKLIRQHCTVALGGDGGDELFGGYMHYDRLLRLNMWRQWIPDGIAGLMASMAERILPVGFRGRNYLMALRARPGRDLVMPAIHFDRTSRKRLLVPDLARTVEEADPQDEKQRMASRFASVLQKATGVDFLAYLCEDILVKVDRASMLTSLEVRAPLLDHRIIEFAYGKTPDYLKATVNERKILLKRLAQKLLPSGFDFKRKQGFSIPMREWFKGDWGNMMREILSEAPRDLFCPRFISSLLNGQKNGRSNGERLFALVLFELWRREYKVACA